MGIMTFLRDRMGKILVIVIGLALFAFIASEVIQFGGSFFRGDANTIGMIGSQKIEAKDFNEKVDQNTEQFRQQSGQGITPQMTGYIQENTWNQMVSQAILSGELARLNLTVGDDEQQAMFSGRNPHPQLVQAFGDPKTGKIDEPKLNQFKANISAAKADDPMKKQWASFVAQVIESKKAEKYISLVTNGLYVNKLEAEDDYEAKNKLANFKYVALDYAGLPDNKVTLTDADYQAYYDAHKTLFKNKQELRSFEYVTFDGSPSKSDSADVKAEITKLVPELKASTDDSLFVQINSETKNPLIFQRKGQLEPALDSVMFSAARGFVYGPYLSNGTYKVAKLVDERVGPDSVKASHILIRPSTAGGVEKAVARIDSLKKLIQGGRSFEELAKTFSDDKASGEQNGSLGTFGRGRMIPIFEDAAFSTPVGQLKVVTSEEGTHLIRVEKVIGSSKVVKVAVIDKPLTPSAATQSAAYSKAQAFLANVGDDFAAEAKKTNTMILPANDVSGISSSLPGLENARELVKWAFKAEKGDISDQVFTIGDKYIVAKLTQVKPEGDLPLEAVKSQLEIVVRNEVKAKQLTEKLQGVLSGASNIDQVAQKAGGKVVPVQNIVLANPILPGLGPEYSLIGSVFGSQPGKLSKAIKGQAGIYAFVLDGFIKPAALTNNVKEKEQLSQTLLQRAQGGVFEALKDKANVKDNRAKFL